MPNYHITVYGENEKIKEYDRDFDSSAEVEKYTKSKYPGLGVITTEN